jgi:hypothetical protein
VEVIGEEMIVVCRDVQIKKITWSLRGGKYRRLQYGWPMLQTSWYQLAAGCKRYEMKTSYNIN